MLHISSKKSILVADKKEKKIMIDKLIEILDNGGYSCVIASGDDIKTFTQRGVDDLYYLVHSEPNFLRGATLADKIIGKGAAALIVKGGVSKIYTHIISQGAYDLFTSEGVEFSYGEIVPHIINRTQTGWCPVEQLCREEHEVDAILARLEEFLASKR